MIHIKEFSLKDLEKTAVRMRMKVIDMIYKAQSEHPGDSLSAADFVTACYFKYMNLDPKNPCWLDRDRMVLSKGHVCPIQYACLAGTGFFPEAHLDTLQMLCLQKRKAQMHLRPYNQRKVRLLYGKSVRMARSSPQSGAV